MNSRSQAVTNSDKTEKDNEKVNWLVEIRGLLLMLLAVLGFHSLVAKPFYIPSTSMVPNLLVGDRLVVSKYPYGWSWVSASFHVLPRSSWRIWSDTPEYGDIVIAVPPNRNEDYIKRVVALPGDRIAVRNGQIILNGNPVPQEVEPNLRLAVDDQQFCDGEPCLGYFDAYRKSGPDGKDVYELPTLRETLPNGATYLIVDHRSQPLDEYPETLVPEGHVFLMGDNRDHSADSREVAIAHGLGGPVPLENIGGRAEFITFSLDGTAGWNPVSWYDALRGERAWSTLRPALAEGGASE